MWDRDLTTAVLAASPGSWGSPHWAVASVYRPELVDSGALMALEALVGLVAWAEPVAELVVPLRRGPHVVVLLHYLDLLWLKNHWHELFVGGFCEVLVFL